MNLYGVLEGKTEARIYAAWLPCLFPGLTRVHRIEDVVDDHYYLLSNMGYPEVLDSVRAAVDDINQQPERFDALLVAVDADDAGAGRRRVHVEQALTGCPVPTLVAIQDCCIESWLLGNRAFVLSHDGASRRDPSTPALAPFRAHYDVCVADPALMPAPAEFIGTRATYHSRYLSAAFAERGQRYSKRHPGQASKQHYLDALKRRFDDTGHIATFGRFLDECSTLADHGRAGSGSTEG